MSAPLPRVRVTAPSTVSAGGRSADAGGGDTSALYVRSLIRSQLRLAVVCAVTFAVLLVAFPVAVTLLPDVAAIPIAGVPLGWIVIGAGVYPVVLLVAWQFVRAADRNEQRYRSLAAEEQ